MFINEVCRMCGLTKKAVGYYEEQNLIQPKVLENGYRDFSGNDVEQLKKITILRKLGLSIPEIRNVLNNGAGTQLQRITEKQALEIESVNQKHKLAKELAKNEDWEAIGLQLEALAKKQSILERLLDVFPGYYGNYIRLHFARYLNEPIVTEEQQNAFETIISFLDNVRFDIPADLQEYLDEATKNFDEDFVQGMSDNLDNAIQDIEKYIADNRQVLEQYMAYKQSDEYRNSPAYKLQECLIKLNNENGYYDIFIPAMKQLSKSYCDYLKAMEQANTVFMQKYPSFRI